MRIREMECRELEEGDAKKIHRMRKRRKRAFESKTKREFEEQEEDKLYM